MRTISRLVQSSHPQCTNMAHMMITRTQRQNLNRRGAKVTKSKWSRVLILLLITTRWLGSISRWLSPLHLLSFLRRRRSLCCCLSVPVYGRLFKLRLQIRRSKWNRSRCRPRCSCYGISSRLIRTFVSVPWSPSFALWSVTLAIFLLISWTSLPSAASAASATSASV